MSFVCKSHSLFGILLSGQSSDTWLTCPNCLHPIMEDIIQNLPKGCINSVSRIISVISEAHTCIYHPIITECNITGAPKSCLQMSKLYCVNFIMLMLYKKDWNQWNKTSLKLHVFGYNRILYPLVCMEVLRLDYMSFSWNNPFFSES